jgi:voltage-gated potassium channel
MPMLILAFVWMALLVAELTWGERVPFAIFGTLIWGVFILDFAIELVLAPRKGAYLKSNWLVALSLLVPALRIFRVFRLFRLFRLARVGRGLRLFRVVTSLNRGMRALGASLRRRGFGYVTATLATFFVGRDAESGEAELAGASEITALRVELIALRGDIRTLSQRSPEP